MTHDMKCAELAEQFFPEGTAQERTELANRIQQAIEDFLEETGILVRGESRQ